VNAFERLESACAGVVERTFAIAFPSALEPVQVARKLVAAFESTPAHPRAGRRFVVAVSRSDFARLAPNRAYLERQWSAMLARLAERSQRPQRAPEVVLVERAGLPRGTVEVGIEALTAPAFLHLRVRKGLPAGAALPLRGSLVIGRGFECDLVLPDPRVSRRHVAVEAGETGVTFHDLGSANGVTVNREKRREGCLDCGDVLLLGDTELVVEADER
jgi:hypothetical protein